MKFSSFCITDNIKYQSSSIILICAVIVACSSGNSNSPNPNVGQIPNDIIPATNAAPTIAGTPNIEVVAGTQYLFTPNASDADDDTLTFDIINKPDWATFDSITGTLDGVPTTTDIGTTNGIVISVTDGTATTALPAFNLTVTNMLSNTDNTAPTIQGTPGTEVTVGTQYSFTPSANDIDGDALTFDIVNKPDWATFDSITGTLEGIPTTTDIGTTNGIVISVSDGTTSIPLNAFNLTVTDIVNPPSPDLDPAKPPSGNFNLSAWKLTLPVSQDSYFGSGGSSAAEILPDGDSGPAVTALNQGFEDSDYFFTATDGTMSFRTPLSGGATTTNTSYVRTELRELYNWTSGQSTSTANWDNEGSHQLEATLSVVEYWPDDPQTVIGQVHAKDSSKALVKLQWDGPDLPVRAIINEDPVSGNPFSLSFDVVGTNEFSYIISLIDNTMSITVNGQTQSVTFGQGNMSLDWDNHVYYFKAGSYPQADKSGGGLFEVHFSSLIVTHSN